MTALPSDQERAPCEATTHRLQKDQITLIDTAIGDRHRQRQRDRSRRGVGVPVDGDDDLAFGYAEFSGRGLNDPPIGLVWYEPIDLLAGDAGAAEGVFDDVGNHADRMLEDLSALHAQVARRLGRRRPAIDIKFVLVPAVRAQMRGQNSGIGCQADALQFLDDHGALANALISLHGATLDPRWLEPVAELSQDILDGFWSEEEGLFHDTARDAEALIVRPRDALDLATPSGNSLAAEGLWRAGRLLDEDDWRHVARRVVLREADTVRRHPSAYGRLLAVADRILAEPLEVAIVGGRDHPETRALHAAALASFQPDLVMTGREEGEALPRPVPLLRERHEVDGEPAAYVCRGYACRAPVTTPEELRAELAS